MLNPDTPDTSMPPALSATQIKVAHITTIDGSLRSLLLNQLRTLKAAGYDVVGISSPGRDVRTLEAAGIRHIAVPMTRSVTPLDDLRSLVRLCRICRQERFTIVHTHNPKPGLLGQLAARLTGVPIVVNTVHGYYFHDQMPARARRFYILLEKIAGRCSDAILSQNQEDMETALKERICPASRIQHLGNGIDLSTFDPDRIDAHEIDRVRKTLGIDANTAVVGFVGRLAARRKGFLSFLAACRQVAARFRSVCFVIVGESDASKGDAVHPSIAQDYGIAEQCRFLGSRPNAELPGLYRLMNVLVLPSIFEGIPRAVMEAASMGVPAVVSDVKGNREAVEHGRNGLLVPFGDVDALADAIAQLLADPAKARALGSEGYRLARERFDERIVFQKVMHEYSRLLRLKGLTVPAAHAFGGHLNGHEKMECPPYLGAMPRT
jgi:glycosyltransferase involved in cell wall biosynthesis